MNLRLITSNIRFDNPADGPNAWPHRRELLAETLLAHSPHIIATQEGRFDQLRELEALLPGYQMVDQHRSWIKQRMYPTFFIRSENFELIGSEDRWLSETPDIAGSTSFGSAFPRLMTWLRVQPVGLRHRLLLVNTHLDHVRPETRTAQIRVLCEELRKIRSTDTHLTVMGDFNDSPESEVRRTLERELNLVDSWLLHNEVEESSHHPFTGKLDTGSRIDWIMVNEGMRVERCFLDKASRGDRWPSDHFPVVCELRL